MTAGPWQQGGLIEAPIRRRLVLQSLAWAGLAACGRAEPPPGLQPAQASEPAPGASRPSDRNHLIGHGIILPGLINERGDGPMMTLVEAVWATQPGLTVSLEALPLERVVDNVINGTADFGFPDVRLPGDVTTQRAYRWSTQPMGQVSFVLYSRQGAVVTRERIEALRQVRPFPLDIEAPDLEFGFPIRRFTSLGSALAKVSAGRLDALLWAQEEADDELRRLQLPNVHRDLFSAFDDVLMLPDGPRGGWVDQAWSLGVAALSDNGRLAELYRDVHRPFDPWQPRAVGLGPAPLPGACRCQRCSHLMR
jgi:polar amino acid transport system substrate-binding protein